jgi:ABC-2 type transport system ATP-binding protein
MICDRVAILVGGRILSQGRLTDLISEKILFTEIVVSGVGEKDLAAHGEPLSAQAGRTLLKVYEEARIQAVLDLVRDRKGKVHSLLPRTQTLEDLFVDMVRPQ